MAIPGYAAEASLYKTTRLYRGYSGVAGVEEGPNVVAQQIGCEAACRASFAICLNGCPPPPPPPPRECPRGQRCCERDVNGDCALCVPEGAECP
jgi:hypothetical protein